MIRKGKDEVCVCVCVRAHATWLFLCMHMYALKHFFVSVYELKFFNISGSDNLFVVMLK